MLRRRTIAIGLALLATVTSLYFWKETLSRDIAGLPSHSQVPRVEFLYQRGDLAEALRLSLELARDDPKNVTINRWLAAIYYDLGAYELATTHLKTIAVLAPEDFSSHRLLGQISEDLENYEIAVTHYTTSLRLGPPLESIRFDILRQRTRCQIKMRDYRSALKSLESRSEDAECLVCKAKCYYYLGDRSRAAELLSRVKNQKQKIGDQFVSQWYLWYLDAALSTEDGQPEDAVQPLRKVLRFSPHNTQSRGLLVSVYRKLGRWKQAEAEQDKKDQSELLLLRLHELTWQATNNLDAEIRDQLAVSCDQVDMPELAKMWRRAAACCRQLGSR